MRKYFITGLATLLPVALTFVVVVFLFNLLTGPFIDLFTSTLHAVHLGPEDLVLFHSPAAFRVFCQILILVLLVGFTVLLGMLTQWFLIHALIGWGEWIVHRIPFISSFYRASKDVVITLFSSNTGAFKQAVLVPYPKADSFTMGFVTSTPALGNSAPKDLIAVFIPTTPNPTSGFLVMYNPKDVIYLDVKIEEAFKFVISCGVVMPAMNSVVTNGNLQP